MNNILFLIGNGFDINHKLKTSYKEFMVWYLNFAIIETFKTSKHYEDACFTLHTTGHLFTCKEQLQILVSNNNLKLIIRTPTTQRNRELNNQLLIVVKNTFVESLLKDCLDSEWNVIEASIYSFIKSQHQYIMKDFEKVSIDRIISGHYHTANSNINSLNDSILCLKEMLHIYLTSLGKPYALKTSFLSNILLENMKNNPITFEQDQEDAPEVLFLNFNYTCYDHLIIKELKNLSFSDELSFTINSIHGSCAGSPEQLVFGIGDEQNRFYDEIETYCGDNWLKSTKSFDYLRNDRYKDLLRFISTNHKYDIYVLGHSCSITDRTLLKMIFDNECCASINIAHHDGLKSYMKTAYNISRNFEDKVKMRSVLQPYNTKLAW